VSKSAKVALVCGAPRNSFFARVGNKKRCRRFRPESSSCNEADNRTTLRCFPGGKAASSAPIRCGELLMKSCLRRCQSGEGLLGVIRKIDNHEPPMPEARWASLQCSIIRSSMCKTMGECLKEVPSKICS
jgi:hypothetical protein